MSAVSIPYPTAVSDSSPVHPCRPLIEAGKRADLILVDTPALSASDKADGICTEAGRCTSRESIATIRWAFVQKNIQPAPIFSLSSEAQVSLRQVRALTSEAVES